MDEPEILEPGPRSDERRTLMHVLYAMHTIAWLSFGVLAVIAVLVNHLRRGDEPDPLYAAHHGYMIRTFWWTLGWMLLTAPLYLLFILPGVVAQGVVGLWYLYRCLRGWLRFVDRRWP